MPAPHAPTGSPPASSRLVEVRVRDVRSAWGPPVTVPLGERVTALVGPNRAGTSTLAWALAAALDPDRPFRPARDRPLGREAEPAVTLVSADGRRSWVRWDPGDGRRTVEGDLRAGHVVLARIHETPRDLLRRAGLDLTDARVRADVAATVRDAARAVVPEVAAVEIPDDLALRILDGVGVALPVPVTRVPVALGLARALAGLSRPPAAVVVEAPDAFLHPAGQESMAAVLDGVAAAVGCPVVITTTSPFVLPRVPEATVVAVARDDSGRTEVVGSAAGHEPQARLLGGLLRDGGLAAVLDRIGRVPPGTRGVLVVEGGTDEAYLRMAAETLDRRAALERVVIDVAGGAMGAALTAIVLRAELDLPLLVLLDHDDAGRRARDTLVSRFGFDRGSQVLTYADVFDGHPTGVVAETLFDLELVRRFVRERGPSASEGERVVQGLTQVDLTPAGKAAFVGWLAGRLRPEHLDRWGRLLDLIEAQLGGGGARGSATPSGIDGEDGPEDV